MRGGAKTRFGTRKVDGVCCFIKYTRNWEGGWFSVNSRYSTLLSSALCVFGSVKNTFLLVS